MTQQKTIDNLKKFYNTNVLLYNSIAFELKFVILKPRLLGRYRPYGYIMLDIQNNDSTYI